MCILGSFFTHDIRVGEPILATPGTWCIEAMILIINSRAEQLYVHGVVSRMWSSHTHTQMTVLAKRKKERKGQRAIC